MMTIGHIELFVKDPTASRKFYEEILGFEVTSIQHNRFVWLKLGSTQILLRPGDGDTATAYARSSNGIVLYTDNLDATMGALTSRGLQFLGNDGSPRCPTF